MVGATHRHGHATGKHDTLDSQRKLKPGLHSPDRNLLNVKSAGDGKGERAEGLKRGLKDSDRHLDATWSRILVFHLREVPKVFLLVPETDRLVW